MESATALTSLDLRGELAAWSRVLGSQLDGAPTPAPDATVIDLDAERAARRAATHRLHLRRRLGVALAVLGTAIALVLLIGAVGATAGVERPATAGRTVLAPGESLWDVAADHAPAGVDARAYVQAIRDVNGFATADVPVWTVILLPAHVG